MTTTLRVKGSPFNPVTRSASVSACEAYRYSLGRRWSKAPPLIFVMLNPSTANALIDDPTIRKCMHYAKREGAGGVYVVNIFAYRATQPPRLRAVSDPVGPENDRHFEIVCEWPHDEGETQPPIVLAWGAIHRSLRDQRETALGWLSGHEDRFRCLGVTKSGEPRHPLYLRNDAPLQTWSPRQ